MRKPFVIGLTGGIGTGKSAVLAHLVALGAEGINADAVAHQVMAPGEPVHAAILAEFGPEMAAENGTIDRRRLAARVFADPAALARLEALVHPAVGDAIARRVATSKAPLVAIEAIKLLEAGLSRRLCDQVWVTTCSRRQQFARLRASRSMTSAEVRRRLRHQMPTEQMIAQADRVIDTGGTPAETGLQVLTAWIELGLPLPAVRIRPGDSSDAEGIAAVLNAVVREGGMTVLDRTFTPAQERAFLRRLSPRARITVAQFGDTVAGFQIVEPYASYTDTMRHVATLGSYVAKPVRGHGVGRALSQATLAVARELGYRKLVVMVRADNPAAQAFYARLGFQACGRLSQQVLIDGRYVDEILLELWIGEPLTAG